MKDIGVIYPQFSVQPKVQHKFMTQLSVLETCEPWIKFNNLLSYSSITFFGNNDLNPYKPPSNNY
jgi:hypothetical protein